MVAILGIFTIQLILGAWTAFSGYKCSLCGRVLASKATWEKHIAVSRFTLYFCSCFSVLISAFDQFGINKEFGELSIKACLSPIL